MKYLVLLLGLAGCTTVPASVDIPLRNPTAPIASQANVTLAGMTGDWVIVQGAGIAPGQRITVSEQGLMLGESLFLLDGPGRFSSEGAQLWVHWIDIGNRTAALGDPNGSRVWIMDRTARSGRDRLTAAREILDWYGYDLRQMKGV